MKVYNILATIIVEDGLSETKIQDVCKENIEKAILEDFEISNCIVHYELKETIDYPDVPKFYVDIGAEKYQNWMKKSQEVLDRISKEMGEP